MKRTRLMFEASSSNPDYSGECDYAIVSLDESDAVRLLSYMDAFLDLKGRCKDASELKVFWCCEWVPYSEKIEELAQTGYFDVLPEGFTADVDPQPTECNRVNTNGNLVWFEAVPKHSDITVWAGYLTRENLENIATGREL